MKRSLLAVVFPVALAALLPAAAHAQTPNCTAQVNGQSVACTFSLQVVVAPALSGVALSNSVFTGPPANAGGVFGAISLVTNPVGGVVSGVMLGLNDPSGNFALSSPTLPSNLIIGPNAVAGGDYPITITATSPAAASATADRRK